MCEAMKENVEIEKNPKVYQMLYHVVIKLLDE
jgi:hypothetical protein